MRVSPVILFLILTYFTCVVVSVCRDHDGDCSGCVNEPSFQCGFCGHTGECLSGDENGPTSPLTESAFGGCDAYWQVDFASHVISTTSGYPVDPTEANIFLYPSDEVTLDVMITRPYSDDVPIDFVVVQDASGSMRPYMKLFGNVVPRIMAGLYSNYKSSYFAHNSYIDKPLHYFARWYIPDYVLQFNTPGLESNPSTMQLAAKISIESIGNGVDVPEDPHDALAMVLDCQNLQKWRSNARKFTFVATDATFHTDTYKYSNSANPTEYTCMYTCYYMFAAGYYDGCRINEKRRNNNNCKNAPDPPGPGSINYASSYCYELIPPPGSTTTSLAGSYYDHCPWKPRTYDLGCPADPDGTRQLTLADCPYVNQEWGIDVNYISTEHLAQKYIEYNTIPIVGSTVSYSETDRKSNTVTDYLEVFESWGFGALLPLGESSDSVVSAILDQIEEVAGKIQLRTLNTDYVKSISPSEGYTNVGVRKNVTFVVTFFHASPVDTELSLVTLGFPSVTVYIWTSVQCFGCDGVARSGNYVDLCGICLPTVRDNCLGCDRIAYSGAVEDLCGECGGSNTACSGCDGIPYSGKVRDACGVCGGDNSTCLDCDDVPNGELRFDSCGICNGTNACIGCDGVAWSNKTYDLCGYCGGTNVCLGCDGVPNSGAVVDSCDVCGGDNECLGCDGVKYSNLTFDECGVCGGDNSSCPFGCDGVRSPNPLVEDQCGVCGGNNTCLGCDFQPWSNLTYDECGICGGDNYCIGCDGIARLDGSSPPSFDLCGVCGGNNTCVGCDFVPNSGLKIDLCNVCGGNNECLGCDGVPNSGAVIDDCGICNGTNACFDCDGVPNGDQQYDACGVCGGTNTTCAGCDKVPYSNTTFDSCGVCNGTNACTYVDNNPIEEPVEIEPWIPATLITIGVVALIAGILAAVAFLSVGAAVGGPLWALPAGLLSQLNSANVSEIHKPREPKVNLRAQ